MQQSPPETRRVQEVISFHEQYKDLYSALPRSVVHQDLNDHNLMVDQTASRIVGVIDFNDAVSTIRAADIGIAASYGMRRSGDPLQNFVHVVRGYERIIPLSVAEREVVFPIAVARLAVNWAVWKSRAVTAPTAYGDARSRRTWPVIETVLHHGLETAQVWILNQLEPVREGI